ncbi:prolyl oligopeptidase family serine peptidase [Cytobacillus kochii]
MVIIDHQELKGIPALHIVKDEFKSQSLPLIFFIHGFTSAKEHNLHYAYLLAEKGFRVILPEVNEHGERGHGLPEPELQLKFWDMIIQTIKELPEIKEELVAKGLVDENRIGVAGTSMGGIITLGALTQYKWLKVAVSLMGMPYYEKFAGMQIETMRKKVKDFPLSDTQVEAVLDEITKYDLSKQEGVLSGRPLLFWHGKKDTTVPFAPTYDFFQTIQPLYKDHPDRLNFIVDENAGHKVSREGLLATVEWFQRYL